jgi:hypothetical protein
VVKNKILDKKSSKWPLFSQLDFKKKKINLFASAFHYFTARNELMIFNCFSVTGGNITLEGQTDGVQSYSSSTGFIGNY